MTPARQEATGDVPPTEVHHLECNVDDMDPRLWPHVIDALLEAGALDAWLSPIIMKRGRPAHTLHALTAADALEAVTEAMFAHTSTIGVRRAQPLHRTTWERGWVTVTIADGAAAGHDVAVKVAHDGATIRNVAPEFRDVAAAAAATGASELDVLDGARAAAVRAGLVRGSAAPVDLR